MHAIGVEESSEVGVPLPIMALVDSPLRQREVDVTLTLRERHLYHSETTVIVVRIPTHSSIQLSLLFATPVKLRSSAMQGLLFPDT